ncbi:MAG: hypothetical protein PHU10_00030 [Bacilli bacterium]|nr:hypothetical protein [Bacilli bacterium]
MRRRICKDKNRCIIIAAMVVLTTLSLGTTSFAWFTTMLNFETGITGSSISNYFAGGNGTALDPFMLTTYKHFYNLSWLQNAGAFSTKRYFKLANDVDMAGTLTGYNSTTSGAIPPIGSDAYPFIGEFDGNGKTISNLWVSSDPYDWKEKPLAITTIDVGTSIGFFGNIGNVLDGTTPYIGVAKSFYLENIEVTCKVEGSIVGIVAGYADGNLQAIGVKNPKISLGTTGINVNSDFSLIGQIGPHVSWDDAPGNLAGGDLIIDPNNPDSPFSPMTTGTRIVEGSAIDTAYYISSLQVTAINGGINSLYKYNNKVVCTTSTTMQVASTNVNPITMITSANYLNYVTEEFYARVNASTTTKSVSFGAIPPSVAPSFSNTLTLTLSDNSTIAVPRNTIWFKPLKGGVSGIAFFRQNQGSTEESISVYHFKRDGTNILNFGEIRFAIGKNVGNKSVVYFDFEIPQTMVNENYEFLIGQSTTNPATTAGFLYLSLAGTDEDSGTQSAQIYAVDYVYRYASGVFEDVMVVDYVPKETMLSFDGLYYGTICYNMLDATPTVANDGKVYYANKTGNIIIFDAIPNTVGVLTTYNTTLFPNREETLIP